MNKTEPLATHSVRNIPRRCSNIASLASSWDMMTKLVESYEPDDNIFAVKPKHQEYAPPPRT